MSVELVESVVSTVVEVPPISNPECNSDNSDDHISCVPNEERIRIALKLMKNGRAPGADGISAELLKLGGDTDCSAVVVALGYCCVGRGKSTRGLGETTYHPFTQKGIYSRL